MEKLHCRFTKVKNNRLLNRVQLVVDVYHAADAKVTKDQIKEVVAAKYKKKHVVLVQVKKLFGGGRTKGIALVYDNEESLKKIENVKRQDREYRESLPLKERKKSQKKKEGRKVRKVKKHQNSKKVGTVKRREKDQKRKQEKKKKK
jgi:small subunit ribosomal protein S24e